MRTKLIVAKTAFRGMEAAANTRSPGSAWQVDDVEPERGSVSITSGASVP